MVSAPTPPMGWNSWDCFGTTVTEAEVLANAQVMHDQLLIAGWDTIVVDIAWYDPTARSHGYNEHAPVVLDDYGRHLPAPLRFPSAAGGAGFEPLAAKVHALGLMFGLHIMRHLSGAKPTSQALSGLSAAPNRLLIRWRAAQPVR